MGLQDANKVDAIGIEKETGKIILTIFDSLDWKSPANHLLALQAKLNAYFNFVEEGQLGETYPASSGRDVVINIITSQALHPLGAELLDRASVASSDLNIQIRTKIEPGLAEG